MADEQRPLADYVADPMAHIVHLKTLLTDVVVAADRFIDNWAEADEAVRKSLWQKLGQAASAAAEEVYPL